LSQVAHRPSAGAKEFMKYGNEGDNRERRRWPSAKAAGQAARIPASKWVGNVGGQWKEFTRFLSDVRAEMRKVVTPSRKEVQATTTVVIIAVFIFGLFFFVVDWIFSLGMNKALLQQAGRIAVAQVSAKREHEDGRRIRTSRTSRRLD
jgi:preprotein translocase subunit SecE